MATLVEIENAPSSKKLIDFLKTMSFVKVIETNEKSARVPNKETIKAMREVKKRKVNSYRNSQDLFKKLDR